MEQEGIEEIFGRSMNKNKTCYTEYYGDGDTKSFSAVENVYGEKSVIRREKIEKGLRKLGLNDAVIDKLQNYYDIAIRGNVGNLEAMKTAIYAAWFAQKAQTVSACTKSMRQTVLLYMFLEMVFLVVR